MRQYGTSYNVDGYQIQLRNQTIARSGGGRNYKAIAELGFSHDLIDTAWSNPDDSSQCYFNNANGATRGYPGLAHNSTLELAIWQTATEDSLLATHLDSTVYNFTIDSKISGLHGAHTVHSEDGKSTIPMEAIGVQCISASAVGTAEVNGITSQYNDFRPSDTQLPENYPCVPRLESVVPRILFVGGAMGNSWSEDFFASAEAPRLHIRPMSEDSGRLVGIRPTLLQATQLRDALVKAYGIAAVQLMYDGAQGYPLQHYDDHGAVYENENVTGYRREQVLVPGPVPPAIPAILLFLWALISCILSVKYGFSRRWADTLDSFSMFQFGGDLSGYFKVKEMPAYSFKDFRDHEQLARLPGLVGDVRPSFTPGHITLVHRNRVNQARKTKRYV